MLTLQAAQEIAGFLESVASSGEEIAFFEPDLGPGSQLFYSSCPSGAGPRTAITELVQGIYEFEPKQARKQARRRIFSTATPTAMCEGMVKVAAKRMTAPVSGSRTSSKLPDWRLQELKPSLSEARASFGLTAPPQIAVFPTNDSSYEEWMRWAFTLAKTQPRGSKSRFEEPRPVAALLISPVLELLAWAVNSNASNRTLHAEVNLVQGWYRARGGAPPPGSRIITTLKPCKMCAGMIHHALPVPVFYGANDPGPMAQNTILETTAMERLFPS